MEGAKKFYSVADYLELEAHSEQKHEFWDGAIVAMPGGAIPHNMISGNAYFALRAIGKKGCTVFNSDQKIFFEALNHFVYPDVSVVCGPIEVSIQDEQNASGSYDGGGNPHERYLCGSAGPESPSNQA